MNVREVDWVNGPMPVIEPSYLARIFAATSDIAFLVRSDGSIMSVLIEKGRDHHKEFMHWGGRQMQDQLTSESIPKFERAIAAVSAGEEFHRRVELNHTDGEDWQFPVRYSFHAVGPGKAILMLGQDLRFEAEMQEQLIQAQISLEQEFEQRRAEDAHFRVILSVTQEPFLLISAADGRIREMNVAAATLLSRLREDLIGVAVSEVLSTGTDMPLAFALASAAAGEEQVRAIVTRSDRAINLLPIVYRATGKRMIFCRILAEEEGAVAARPLMTDLLTLFEKSSEAVAFSDGAGQIIEANDAFLELLGLGDTADAVGHSLADFLHRGEIDLGVILKQVRQSGRISIYSTRIASRFGARRLVNLSATALDESASRIGFVLRDAEKTDVIRRAASLPDSEAAPVPSVVSMVGSATLKEIVAEANEEIEKICIEAAVELTHGNRAAAAEMLGMSRQSLYVKLRKYGLHERSEDR